MFKIGEKTDLKGTMQPSVQTRTWQLASFGALLSLVSISLLSGCASTLYGGGDFSRESVGASVFENVHTRTAQVKTTKAYLSAKMMTKSRFYGANAGAYVFEATPLGILAPLFNYPRKTYTIWVRLNIQTDQPLAQSRIKHLLSFTDIDGKRGTKSIDLQFNKDLDEEIRRTGRSTQFSPDHIEVVLTCEDNVCSVHATPDLITDDGHVQLISKTVEDKNRIFEIKQAVEKAERKRIEDARQEKLRRATMAELERSRLSQRASKCPALLQQLRILAGSANDAVYLVGVQEVQRRLAETQRDIDYYDCLR